MQSISQTLTASMREQIEHCFQAPLHEDYGLNEFGIIASRCPEGGRFHVHGEHCIVEIVDEQGMPAAPGSFGRVLVTTLNNYVMPLIRYDTGDFARALSGPCACGRQLAGFGEIKGRYRRVAQLPEGSWDYWWALQSALLTMPTALMAEMQRYQLHQSADGEFELRIESAGALSAAFRHYVQQCWHSVVVANPKTLHIAAVKQINTPANQKFDNFISDCVESLENAFAQS